MVRCGWPSTRSIAQSSRWRAAKPRAASATATALSNAASSATRLRNFSARSSVCRISGRPLSSDSMRTPRTSPALGLGLAHSVKARTGPSSPATAKRQVMRLAGCTSLVAGRSAALSSTRGAKVEKPVPRSGSSSTTRPMRSWASPSSSGSPGARPSASSRGLSTQASPRAGMSRVVAPGPSGVAATVRLPRSG
jgi:hypothetical protein